MPKHHFIPAFYLQQWVGEDDGEVIEYSRPYRRVVAKPVGPNATGFEFDLYAFNELPPKDAQYLERVFFNYVDNTSSIALRAHSADTGNFIWTGELRSAWSRFIIALHLRHPDTMPELRSAAQRIWNDSGLVSQQEYERLKAPQDPSTFDEYIAARDPLLEVKARINLIIKTFDNDEVGHHINNMIWSILDVSKAPITLLTSDRPVGLAKIKEPQGLVSVPISPTKIFVAVNNRSILDELSKRRPTEIIKASNKYVVQRARRYVWAKDQSQNRFIENNMSTELESTPFFPSL